MKTEKLRPEDFYAIDAGELEWTPLRHCMKLFLAM
jgi:hypothetical protein